jgi:crotonobetainyl-CoA:carnitine CoA-transferase CaiB-like acyl-CoA transferase
LVAKADIVVENFAADTMDRLGIGWSVLREINPRLINAAGSGFGRSGPYRNYPAMGLTVQAIAGLMSVTGFPDREPVKCGPAIADLSGGIHLYGAAIAIICVGDRHWKALTRVMSVPQFGDDLRFRTLKVRVAHMDAVDEIVSGWTAQHLKEDVFQALAGVGVPAAPVRDLDEVAHDLNLHERGMLQHVEHPEYGPMILPHSPLRFEGLTPSGLSPSPRLGEGRDALKSVLDISEDELDALCADGVLGTGVSEQ